MIVRRHYPSISSSAFYFLIRTKKIIFLLFVLLVLPSGFSFIQYRQCKHQLDLFCLRVSLSNSVKEFIA